MYIFPLLLIHLGNHVALSLQVSTANMKLQCSNQFSESSIRLCKTGNTHRIADEKYNCDLGYVCTEPLSILQTLTNKLDRVWSASKQAFIDKIEEAADTKKVTTHAIELPPKGFLGVCFPEHDVKLGYSSSENSAQCLRLYGSTCQGKGGICHRTRESSGFSTQSNCAFGNECRKTKTKQKTKEDDGAIETVIDMSEKTLPYELGICTPRFLTAFDRSFPQTQNMIQVYHNIQKKLLPQSKTSEEMIKCGIIEPKYYEGFAKLAVVNKEPICTYSEYIQAIDTIFDAKMTIHFEGQALGHEDNHPASSTVETSRQADSPYEKPFTLRLVERNWNHAQDREIKYSSKQLFQYEIRQQKHHADPSKWKERRKQMFLEKTTCDIMEEMTLKSLLGKQKSDRSKQKKEEKRKASMTGSRKDLQTSTGTDLLATVSSFTGSLLDGNKDKAQKPNDDEFVQGFDHSKNPTMTKQELFAQRETMKRQQQAEQGWKSTAKYVKVPDQKEEATSVRGGPIGFGVGSSSTGNHRRRSLAQPLLGGKANSIN
eukprot:g1371.t1